MGKYITDFDHKVTAIDPTYRRGQFQTFMSAPEWRNVEMAEEYAAFLAEGNAMFQFPYFRQTLDLWRISWHTFWAAKRYDSAWTILTSEDMLMDVFITFFTSCELIPKGVIALLLRPFLNAKNNTDFQKAVATMYGDYTKKLQTIPFYSHDYADVKTKLAAKYDSLKNKTWVDWFTWKLVSAELTLRRVISWPLNYWFNAGGNDTVPRTTDVLVKMALNTPIEAEEKYNKGNKATYARVRAPRYKDFMDTVADYSKQGITIKKIAGQDNIQVKCEIRSADLDNVESKLKKHATLLYTYGDRIHTDRRFCLFVTPVKQLQKTIEAFNTVENTTVAFIHNF